MLRDSKEAFTARKVADISKEVGRVRSSGALEAVNMTLAFTLSEMGSE